MANERSQVLEELERLQAHGYHDEDRVQRMIREAKSVGRGQIEHREKFLSLLWHKVRECRILTPPGRPRNLKAVVQYMSQQGWDFDRLASEPPLDPHYHDINWFSKCLRLYDDFDPTKLHYLLLRKLNLKERKQWQGSTRYILDGCGRSLVYAYLLEMEQVCYEPVRFILVDLPDGWTG